MLAIVGTTRSGAVSPGGVALALNVYGMPASEFELGIKDKL